MIIRLGPPSNILTGFDIDTANFTGNEGPAADVWGLKLDGLDVEKQEKGLEGDDPRVSRAMTRHSAGIEMGSTRADPIWLYGGVDRGSGNSFYQKSRLDPVRGIFSRLNRRARLIRM